MKTQNHAFGRRLVSTSLALTLIAGLVPAGSLAYAAEQAEEAAAQADQQAQEAAEAAEAVGQAVISQTIALDSSAADEAPADSSAAAQAAADEAAPAPDAPASEATPAYTSDTADRIQADVPVGTGSADALVGSIEYEGLAYRINPGTHTVTLVGLGTQAPAADLVIPSQVAAAGKLYTVSGIENVRGGFTANPS